MTQAYSSYHYQQYSAAKAWEQLMALMVQEFECWRMFGYQVDHDFQDCVYIYDPNSAARKKTQ